LLTAILYIVAFEKIAQRYGMLFNKKSVFIIALLSIAGGVSLAGFYGYQQQTTDNAAAQIPAHIEQAPQQEFDDIVRCSAMLAAYEGAVEGELKPGSTTFNAISYALGKAQELGGNIGLAAGEVRLQYDQRTLGYFMEYMNDKPGSIARYAKEAAQCKTQLAQYEPGAQIEASIKKAKALAQEQAR
jgi:hypothetical protein